MGVLTGGLSAVVGGVTFAAHLADAKSFVNGLWNSLDAISNERGSVVSRQGFDDSPVLPPKPANNNSPQYPQGNAPSQYPQGNVPSQYPQGNAPPQYPQGNAPSQYPQGNVPAQYPQGNVPSQYPQGNAPSQYPQGNAPSQYPQGNAPSQYPQGNAPPQYPPQQGYSTPSLYPQNVTTPQGPLDLKPIGTIDALEQMLQYHKAAVWQLEGEISERKRQTYSPQPYSNPGYPQGYAPQQGYPPQQPPLSPSAQNNQGNTPSVQ